MIKHADFSLSIAGLQVPLSLHHADAAAYFGTYAGPVDTLAGDSISVASFQWNAWLADGGLDDGYSEYTCLTAAVSDALLQHDRCIIHAAAFRFGASAWLIAGPPGVGKSTQVRNLQELQPGEFSVICGDRPALQLRDDDVFVHPSPWNGKEGWHGAGGAPLAGLILLERGEENRFFPLTPREAVFPLLSSLIHTGETEETIRRLARFADSFLGLVPVFRLCSHDIPASSELLYQSLFSGRCSD